MYEYHAIACLSFIFCHGASYEILDIYIKVRTKIVTYFKWEEL